MGGKSQASEPSGYLGDMNEFQEESLAALRAKYVDNETHKLNPWMDDMFLLRFLRFKKFDVEATFKMLNECIEWRQAEGIDTIL
jgi:hypothetical protein